MEARRWAVSAELTDPVIVPAEAAAAARQDVRSVASSAGVRRGVGITISRYPAGLGPDREGAAEATRR